MAEEIRIANNVNNPQFLAAWQLSPRLPKWQLDSGLVKPKRATPEEDAIAREAKRRKKSKQYDRAREALANTSKDPDSFNFIERKVAIECYPDMFEEVIGGSRFSKVKRRETSLNETPSTEVDLSEFRISNLNDVCTYKFIARTTSVGEETRPPPMRTIPFNSHWEIGECVSSVRCAGTTTVTNPYQNTARANFPCVSRVMTD